MIACHSYSEKCEEQKAGMRPVNGVILMERYGLMSSDG